MRFGEFFSKYSTSAAEVFLLVLVLLSYSCNEYTSYNKLYTSIYIYLRLQCKYETFSVLSVLFAHLLQEYISENFGSAFHASPYHLVWLCHIFDIQTIPDKSLLPK